jgi:hypothetical protein
MSMITTRNKVFQDKSYDVYFQEEYGYGKTLLSVNHRPVLCPFSGNVDFNQGAPFRSQYNLFTDY